MQKVSLRLLLGKCVTKQEMQNAAKMVLQEPFTGRITDLRRHRYRSRCRTGRRKPIHRHFSIPDSGTFRSRQQQMSHFPIYSGSVWGLTAWRQAALSAIMKSCRDCMKIPSGASGTILHGSLRTVRSVMNGLAGQEIWRSTAGPHFISRISMLSMQSGAGIS